MAAVDIDQLEQKVLMAEKYETSELTRARNIRWLERYISNPQQWRNVMQWCEREFNRTLEGSWLFSIIITLLSACLLPVSLWMLVPTILFAGIAAGVFITAADVYPTLINADTAYQAIPYITSSIEDDCVSIALKQNDDIVHHQTFQPGQVEEALSYQVMLEETIEQTRAVLEQTLVTRATEGMAAAAAAKQHQQLAAREAAKQEKQAAKEAKQQARQQRRISKDKRLAAQHKLIAAIDSNEDLDFDGDSEDLLAVIRDQSAITHR